MQDIFLYENAGASVLMIFISFFICSIWKKNDVICICILLISMVDFKIHRPIEKNCSV